MKQIGLLLLCAIFFVVGVLFDGLITRVPDESHAVTQMCVVERGVKAYHQSHKALPQSLDDLLRFSPEIENCLTNRWGMPICYRAVDASNAVITAVAYGDVEFVKRISITHADE